MDIAKMESTKMPPVFIWGVVAICVAPLLLNFVGVDFATHPEVYPGANATDAMFHKLSGAFTHTILEWSAFMAAMLTVFLAFTQYRISNDVTTPVIAVALFMAGCMDAFHTLAADRLIEAVTDNRNLIPFTWAIARIFSALIMIVGVGMFLVRVGENRRLGISVATDGDRRKKGRYRFIIGVSLIFGAVAYLVIHACANSESLPNTMFPDSLITRPWDIAPLILFIFAGTVIYPSFYRRVPSLFSHALIIAVIPEVATQLYMAFGSTKLFDNAFNSAHFLKIICYLVPFAGLCLDYIKTYHTRNAVAAQIQKTNEALARDITERKLVEEELMASEAKQRMILESAVNGIITIDIYGTIELFNPASEKLFGYKSAEVINKNIKMLMPEPYQSEHDGYLGNYRETGERKVIGIGREVVGRRKDGSLFPMDLGVSDMKGSGKAGYVGTITDITERKLTEEKLIRATESAEIARQDAEEANVAKSEFLASMSHEIRTPMNAILGMAELLSETELDSEQRRYITTFSSAGETLMEIINDILDLSKIEAGELTMERVSFDIGLLLEQVGEIMAVRAHEKGLELIFVLPDSVPNGLIGDPTRLRQIVTNLIGNAIKFTEKGQIMVEVEVEEQSAEMIDLVFSVRDTGIGIKPEQLDTIFQSFTQADSSVTRKYGGTGLGLTISRLFVELMDGRLWVESKVGVGSVFYFTARFGVAQIEEGTEMTNAMLVDLTGRNVLVVDDNAASREMFRRTLESCGAKVSEADSGVIGLKMLRQAITGDVPYHLLIIDYQMPGMDGLQMAEEIKRDPRFNTILLIMASSGMNGVRKTRIRELGISSLLTKPVKRAELLTALKKISGVGSEEPARLRAVTKEPGVTDRVETLNILLVDDNVDNRNLILAYLKKTPHQVTAAEDGKIAVEKFENGHFDIVLMDMEMPVMDGYSATRAIRVIEEKSSLMPTPIIALTAHALKEHEQKSLDAGCDGHLTKPIKKKVLLKALAQFTSN